MSDKRASERVNVAAVGQKHKRARARAQSCQLASDTKLVVAENSQLGAILCFYARLLNRMRASERARVISSCSR